MATSDKNIVITPNIGSSTDDPKIVFSGADSTTSAQNITLKAYPTSNGTLSFEGSAGQLFSVTNSLTGTIFSVNDVSGIPSIEVLDTGTIKLAQYSGNVGVGDAAPAQKLSVTGNIAATGTVTGTNITIIQGVDTTQNTNIATIQGVDLTQNSSISAAFGLANTLQGGLNTANANIVIGQGVNNTQNANITIIQGVDVGQNAAITAIQGVDLTQNASISAAYGLANTLQGGLNTANANIVIGQGVNNTQNAAITIIQGVDLTQNASISAAYGLANTLQGGLNTANANIVIGQGVNNTQNAAITIIQGVDTTQNASITIIQGVDTTQNTNIATIQGVDLTQNASISAAYTLANTLQGGLNTANANIVIGQGVNNTQNAAITIIQGVDTTQNAAITIIQGVDLTQNASITAAFNKANTSLTSSGYLPNAIIYANNTGYLSNTRPLSFYTSNNALILSAVSVPTVDMLQITNAGAGITTAGISALQVHYTGGAGAIESSASRIDLEAGTTSGSTWNGFRVVTVTPPAAGVTINGIKFDNITAGAGNNNIFYAGTGYDNIMSYNGNTLISGTGIISNAAISGSYSNFANITASGTITAYSDRRLKENLDQIPDALEKVQQLTGYTFSRIDTGERQTGLIAQDVQKVLPEAVMEGKHLSLAYGNLAGLLVEAIKELNAKVTSLEEKLK
jgi:hypothetical protein